MPLIKPRTRGKQILRHIARLDRENIETLHAYAAFLGESTDYVLNQVIDTVLARDKEFVKWRADHAHSHVPNTCQPGHDGTAPRQFVIRPRQCHRRRGHPYHCQ